MYLFSYFGVEISFGCMVIIASLYEVLTFILLLYLQHYFFLFILFSIFQVKGFPLITQALYLTIFKSETPAGSSGDVRGAGLM